MMQSKDAHIAHDETTGGVHMRKPILCLALALTLLFACAFPASAADYAEMIADVLDTLERNNALCESAPQQTANGLYRAVDMLAIIAYAQDQNGQYASLISDVLDNLSAQNELCESAPQQCANGAYRMVDMLAIIALEKDGLGLYGGAVSDVLDRLSTQDALCDSAPKQLVNGLYRAVELAAIIAMQTNSGANLFI